MFDRLHLPTGSNLLEEYVTSKLERHADQLAALGHPGRLAIIRFTVRAGEDGTSAGDIQANVDMPGSTLSHHLKRLVRAGLLNSRTEGTYHYYAPDLSALRALTDYVWEDCCKRGKKASCC